MDITKPSDWISVRVYGDAIILSDGRATEDGGTTFRKATEEEMRGFRNGSEDVK